MDVTYTVGEFKKLVAESSNQFNAKLGAGVESENKKNNDKSYEEATKRAKDFDGGLQDPKEPETPEFDDINRTTLDYNPENASNEYKERVHAQAKGYTSTAEEENGIEKSGDFNDRSYQAIKKRGQKIHKKEEDLKKSGLQAREMPDGTFKKDDMYVTDNGNIKANIDANTKKINDIADGKKNVGPMKESSDRKMKTIVFKKTEFLNEYKMVSRIPDEFKKEGNVFKMKDKTGDTYIVEWTSNKANILEHSDKKGLVESVDRMKSLFNYKPSEYVDGTNCISRINESNEEFQRALDNMRKIIK